MLLPALLVGLLAAPRLPQEDSLLAAIPENAFALLHVAEPIALRSRAERNDWVALLGSPDGEQALGELEREYEQATGADFDGLLGLALELHGEALLFFTGEVAGFLTSTPPDRAALAAALSGWLPGEPRARRTIEVVGGSVQMAAWPLRADARAEGEGRFLAFLDHPLAMGLFSGDGAEKVLEALTSCLGRLGSDRRAPVVEGYLAAGGGTHRGIEAFVDFTPFVTVVENNLRKAMEGVLPDPTGLLGLERGTWLFCSADVSPGTRVEVRAQLHIPEDTLAAQLADCFEALPATLPADLPRGTWSAWALNWNLRRFYATARAALVQADEDGLAVIDQGLTAAEEFSGVDPVEDIIGQFAGLFAVYFTLNRDGSLLDSEEAFGFLLGLIDGDRFLDVFEDLLLAGGIDIDSIELEGAETFLFPADFGLDGGWSILPRHLFVSGSRDILVRGLRALGRVEGAALAADSQLQGALDENAGAFAFAYTQLLHTRALVFPEQAEAALGEHDPFDSQLIVSAKRTAGGFELQLHTR